MDYRDQMGRITERINEIWLQLMEIARNEREAIHDHIERAENTTVELKTLEEYNTEQAVSFAKRQAQALKPRFNHIACPECGCELVDGSLIGKWDMFSDKIQKISVKCINPDCLWSGEKSKA